MSDQSLQEFKKSISGNMQIIGQIRLVAIVKNNIS